MQRDEWCGGMRLGSCSGRNGERDRKQVTLCPEEGRPTMVKGPEQSRRMRSKDLGIRRQHIWWLREGEETGVKIDLFLEKFNY